MTDSKFDDLLIKLGTRKWNYFCFSIVCWFVFLLPSQLISIVFAAPSVTFTCKIPREEEELVPEQNLKGSCSYIVNSTLPGGEPQTKPCRDWDFDTSTFSRSLTSEYQLVCGREFLRTAYHGVFMIGNVLGPPTGGFLSDKYGRRIVIITGGIAFAASTIFLPFIPSFPGILAVRFLIGFSTLPAAFVMAMEVCEPRKRPFVGIIVASPFSLGSIAFGGVAYFVRDWYWLQFIMSVPIMLISPAIWLLDESPRWLIVTGQHERALDTLKRAARWNNVSLPPDSELRDLMNEIQHENKEASASKSGNYLSVSERLEVTRKSSSGSPKPSCFAKCGFCSTAHIRILNVIMPLCFFVSSLVFHGLIVSSENFSINIFAYVIIGGIVEVPAYVGAAFIVARFGNRRPLSVCFFICGISLIAIVVSPQDITWLIMALAMIGKLCITSVGQMINLYVSELYPTEYRLQGMGIAMLTQRLGSMIAPVIVFLLGPLSWWGPSAVMGAMALIASMVTLILPETLGAVLPDTLGDLDELFANMKKKKQSYKDASGEGEEMESLDLE